MDGYVSIADVRRALPRLDFPRGLLGRGINALRANGLTQSQSEMLMFGGYDFAMSGGKRSLLQKGKEKYLYANDVAPASDAVARLLARAEAML